MGEKGPIHAVLDSTGLKVYGEGEWKVRKHGYSKRRTWRKLHLCVDEASGEIEAEVLIDARVDDAEVPEELLKQTKPEIEQMSGDGAYDKEKVHKVATLAGVGKITVPPRRDAVLWEERDGQAHPRNTNLRWVKEIGRAEWKVESGYHRRSLAETAIFQFKTIFGDHLDAREEKRQRTEARIKCAGGARAANFAALAVRFWASSGRETIPKKENFYKPREKKRRLVMSRLSGCDGLVVFGGHFDPLCRAIGERFF